MSFELMMTCNHIILCRPLLLLPSVFPSILRIKKCGKTQGLRGGIRKEKMEERAEGRWGANEPHASLHQDMGTFPGQPGQEPSSEGSSGQGRSPGNHRLGTPQASRGFACRRACAVITWRIWDKIENLYHFLLPRQKRIFRLSSWRNTSLCAHSLDVGNAASETSHHNILGELDPTSRTFTTSQQPQRNVITWTDHGGKQILTKEQIKTHQINTQTGVDLMSSEATQTRP